MTNDWSKTRVGLFGAAALVAAGTMSVGAQAQVVAGQSPAVPVVLNDPSAPDDGALDTALDSLETTGKSLHSFDRPVYARFLPVGAGGISGPVINARHDGGVTPVLGVYGGTLTGPVINVRHDGGVGPIPEPTTWLTMLIGFAGVGFALRNSRRATRTARA